MSNRNHWSRKMKRGIAMRFLALATLVFTFPFFQAQGAGEMASSEITKKSMNEFLENFMALKKYLVSDAEFQDPKNAEEISKHLKNLDTAVRQTGHNPMLNQENFKFSREALEDHVHETERVFRLGNKSYARWMLNSTLGICMSCHTQMPTTGNFNVFMKPNFFNSDFDRAEFLFATKNFEGASQIFRNLIAEYPKVFTSDDKLEKSMRRELVYRIRVKRDLKGAQEAVSEALKNKKLPEFLIKNLKAWSDQLNKWSKKTLPQVQDAKPKDIVEFAEKNVSFGANRGELEASDPRYISNLIVSGILYEFLQKRPESQGTPDVLYSLAIIDRELNNSFFFSLADMYLKECMLKYPESPKAMKCYSEYESEMIFGYTGSAGTSLPREVLEDLKFLKNYIESKGKVPLQRRAP